MNGDMDERAKSCSLKGLIGLCAGLLLVVSCAAPTSRTASDKPTFVSLNPCLDAILVEVAAPEQILALSHYSSDPASTSMDVEVARGFAMTGGTAEEIIALSPDVVVASTFIAPATHAALERAGLRVETFGNAQTVEESVDQVRLLADLVGAPAAGERLAENIAGQPALAAAPGVSALLWQPGQIVAGQATMVAQHIEWAGLQNHAIAMGLAQADHVSFETILANPPRILLIAGDSAGQTHPLLEHLSGTLVAEYPPSLMYCAGPTLPKARAHLAKIRAEFERDLYEERNW